MSNQKNDPPISSLKGHKLIIACDRFLTALSKRGEDKKKPTCPNVEREIWEAVREVLAAHTHYIETYPDAPFPHGVSYFLMDAISEILAGGEPDSIWVMRHTGKKAGAPKRSDNENRNISAAATYIVASEQGLIEDPYPKRTVREHFGVAPTTLRGWCRESQFDYLNPSTLLEKNPRLGDTLEAMMLDAAREYRQARRTRSHTAVQKRGKKK